MGKNIEHKIQLNVVLIYLIVAVFCGGLVWYYYKTGYNIDDQKRDVDNHYKNLSLANELIHHVNQTQAEANLYVVTKQQQHLDCFTENIQEVDSLIHSFRLSTEELSIDSLLEQVNLLLLEKGEIITALNKMFRNMPKTNPVLESIQAYELPKPVEVKKEDTVTVVTVIQDTIIQQAPKRNFWKRIFSPEEKKDTIINVTTVLTDTIKVEVPTPIDSSLYISEMNRIVEQVSRNYTGRINAIERQVSQLVMADQEISVRISDALIQLYSHIVDSRLLEIKAEEAFLAENNSRAIKWSVIALIIILIFIILIISDANKGYRSRKALEAANVKMQQIMDSRHKLLLSVSHDIKTPLNSILGYLELSHNKDGLTEKEVEHMENAGSHILALLENLLEFSSLEQGTLKPAYRDFLLLTVCRETAAMFAPLARKKNLFFDCKFNFNFQLCLRFDSLMLKQILTNVLSNAVKYTRYGGITFEVSYSDHELVICISDTGIGIPAEQLPGVYQPFSRIEQNNLVADGSGFGLYVVKGLVDLLEGQIDISSIEDKGTKIKIVLPAVRVNSKAEPSPQKILIIDDDISFLTMIREMGEQLGHEISICSSLTEFEEHLHQLFEYDKVLTDLVMDVYTGKDVLQRIRDRSKGIPVIAMTARASYNADMAKDSGFDGYLSKPVTKHSFQYIIGEYTETISQEELFGEIFEQDKESMIEVLGIFIQATLSNLVLLRQAIKEDDFRKAQLLCHKMLPMFMQLDAKEVVPLLKEMDTLRSKTAEDVPGWKEKINELINKTGDLLIRIQKDYLND